MFSGLRSFLNRITAEPGGSLDAEKVCGLMGKFVGGASDFDRYALSAFKKMKIPVNLKEDIKLIARAKRTNSDSLILNYLTQMIEKDMHWLLKKKWKTKATDYLCPLCGERSVAIELIESEYHELYHYCNETPKYIAQCLSCEGESEPKETPGQARINILPYEKIKKIKDEYFFYLHKRTE